MPLPLRALRGLLIVALAAAPLTGCTDSGPSDEFFLNLSVNKNRSNVAERDDAGRTELVTISANAPGASDSHFVGLSVSDYALFHKTGADEISPDSFTLVALADGKGTAGLRCSGNTGTASIRGFLLDPGGNPVAEGTTTVDCYLDNPSLYRLSLSLSEGVAPVGSCVEAEIRGFKDNGEAAEGLNAIIGCDGCEFEGDDPSVLEGVAAGELNRKGFFLDNNGAAKADICCKTEGRVGVRAEWDGEQYGDPDRVPSEALQCIQEGGEAGIIVDPDPPEAIRVGNDARESRRELTVFLRGPGGLPVQGGTINSISTNLGMLSLDLEDTPPPDTPENKRLRAVELEAGKRVFYLWAGNKAGNALIDFVAAVRVPGQDDLILQHRVQVPIIGLGEIDCIPPQQSFLTVAGSGGVETTQICFEVRSTEDEPLPNFPVDFELPTTLECPGDPSSCGTAWIAPVRAETQSDGRACTFLHAGRSAQPVAVRAVGRLQGAALVSDCPAIPVVGGRASARGLGIRCRDLNVGALLQHDGINGLIDHEMPCVVSLKDRFGNPVPQPTDVSFRSEAGTISHSVRTPGRRDSQAGSGESPDTSTAKAIFSTFGALPKDVTPMPRDPDVGRDRAEPSYEDLNGRIHNPRDGLVTIIAYVVGEEEFTDLDGDGAYTPGEPFIDLAEPFVDFDDNGLRDLDEPFIDFDVQADGDDLSAGCPPGVNARRSRAGIHDGPNGCWDANGLIWTQTRVLYTGGPYDGGDSRSSGFLPFGLVEDDPQFRLQKISSQLFKVRIVDENLNLLNPSMSIELLLRGAAEIIQGATGQLSVPDSLGIGFSLQKVCNALSGICSVSPRITGFSQWSEPEGSGYDFLFTASSNAPADGPCCAPRPPQGSDELPVLLPEDRRADKCQPPDGFVFPDEVPEEAAGEGEGEPPDAPQAWDPALFEDTMIRVTVKYGVGAGASDARTWEDSWEIQGWGCGTTVLDSATEDDIEAPTSCFTGRVLGPRQVPVEGAVVTILDPDEGFNPVPAVTDENGDYCLVSSLGRHEIQAELDSEEDDGFRCRSEVSSFQVEVGESDCDADCRAGPVLECEAIEGGGGPPDGGDDGGDDGGPPDDGEGDGGPPDDGGGEP